jgi:uncharacterized protein DUF1707
MQAIDVRAADADRERVVAELQRHTSAGRLSMEEFSERTAAVYRSRTMNELASLTADLPAESQPVPESDRGPIRTLLIALVLSVVAVALLGFVSAGHAGPLLAGLACW